jgi:hypothetical protein
MNRLVPGDPGRKYPALEKFNNTLIKTGSNLTLVDQGVWAGTTGLVDRDYPVTSAESGEIIRAGSGFVKENLPRKT